LIVMAGPPSAEARKICWSARDRYFNCRISYSTEEDRDKNCLQLKNQFENSCPASWVKHFLKRQSWNEYKKELSEKAKEAE